MNFIIIGVSLFIVLLMLANKILEKKIGAKTALTRLANHGDALFLSLFERGRASLNFLKEHVIFMALVWLPGRIEHFSSKIKRRSLSKYQSLSGKMRGERPLTRGQASPFMRTLASRSGFENRQ